MKKILAVTILFIILVTLFAGCTKPAVQPETTTPVPAAGNEENPPSTPESSAKIASSGVDTQGKLNGRIDGNSVEIEINPEDVLAFRVTDVIDQLKDIKDGDMVKFTYEANDHGQLNITKIEKIK